MWPAIVVDLHDSSPDWTALAGIAAGVVGTAFGYFAARSGDTRRYRHEEAMADIADLRQIVERALTMFDAYLDRIGELHKADIELRRTRAEINAMDGDPNSDPPPALVRRLRDLQEQIQPLRDSARRQEFFEAAALAEAGLVTRLRPDDPIVTAYRETFGAMVKLVEAQEGDDETVVVSEAAACRTKKNEFAARAQERLGSRLAAEPKKTARRRRRRPR